MSLSFSPSSADTDAFKRRPNPKRQSEQQQHQYILPKYITASNGLTISRQLTKWIQSGHELDVLVLRGPSQSNSSRIRDDANEFSPSQGVGFDEEDGGIPPYLVGLLQDLILSKPYWKKIEFSGKTPHATERILQSTMILREGTTRSIGFNNDTTRRKGKRKECLSRVYVPQLDKLVVEHATDRILNTVANMLNPSHESCSQSPSSEGSIVASATVHRLALRWTEFSVAAVQALSRGLIPHPTVNFPPNFTRTPLRGLFLTGSTFADDAVPLFSDMLSSVTSLEELALSDCHLEDDEVSIIVRALFDTPHPRLKSLDVSCNFVQEEATMALAQLISQRSTLLNDAAEISKNSFVSLLSLDINNQDVWDNREYLEPLMEALAGVDRRILERTEGTTIVEEQNACSTYNTAVESIDWSHNFLDDNHIRTLCRCFSLSASRLMNINLQKLVLRGNSIADDGVGYIAEALPAMQYLSVLDLRLNPKITDDGVHTLSEALRQLHTRITIDNFKDKIDSRNDSKRVAGGQSLWHIFIDQPSQSFLMQLVLHRAGRTRLLYQEGKGHPVQANLWPLVLERANRCCIQADVDSFDEEVCIHGIYPADLIFELFRLGHASMLDCCQ
ncbi:leucine rich repeat LRR-containing protein [Nitzschia inconspicua]|uniref:Leucine rich repeat LRR-containing protein n=1 Tax=Nitzschia inconspicua TaxID=303405 RepID=A0A9K3LV34_9STRA|nr:leucine rich repeat LRR-containing protein [Nitzschia inconspicua]